MSRQAKRAARPAPRTAEFATVPGLRPVGGALCAVIALMLLVQQLRIDGAEPGLRLAGLAGAAFFGVSAFYMIRRSFRRGLALRVGPEGAGFALGFHGWVEVPWEQVRAWRYWEPTGLSQMLKRHQPRWVGISLKDDSVLAGRPWDERLEMWLGRTYGRPPLCVLHPFIGAPILEVLEAFQTHAPALNDPEGRIIR